MNSPSASVLVTRPVHQSSELIKLLNDKGIASVCLATIEIDYLHADLTDTLQSDLIIFTSVNAVHGANKSMALPFNSHAKIASIGKATTLALENLNCSVDVSPETGASSEALLEVIGDVKNLAVTIVRGDTGRDALRAALTKRGATVRYLSVYQRKLPTYTKTEIQTLLKHGLPDVTSVTSDLGLHNLLAIIPNEFKAELFTKPLVVNSERCAKLARDLGFTADVLVADPPGNESQVKLITKLVGSDRV